MSNYMSLAPMKLAISLSKNEIKTITPYALLLQIIILTLNARVKIIGWVLIKEQMERVAVCNTIKKNFYRQIMIVQTENAKCINQITLHMFKCISCAKKKNSCL